MELSLERARELAETYLLPVGVKLLIALVILFFGRMIAKAIWRALDRVLERGKVDISLRKFLGDVVYAVLFVAVVIAALDELGVRTTAVLAILGAAGLAIGLAVQGSLSNFAAGVLLIVLRPYRVDDVVTVGKYTGRVDIIRVFNTVLITADNREIMIPNGQIIAQPIENLTALGKRRVDFLVTVTEPRDLAKIRALLDDIIRGDERVQQPPPSIDVAEITDASVKLYLRPWTSVDHYAQVAGDTMERIKSSFEAAGMKYSIVLQAPA
jgi:small conductance mechanosensitive channel